MAYSEKLFERYIRERVVKNTVGVSMKDYPGTREVQVEATVMMFLSMAQSIAAREGASAAFRALRNAAKPPHHQERSGK